MQTVIDYKDQEIFPCNLQPKLDGIRCKIERIDGKWIAYSRNGTDVTADMQRHIDALAAVVAPGDAEHIYFDGELRHPHGFKQTVGSFNSHQFHRLMFHIFEASVPVRDTGLCVNVPTRKCDSKREAEVLLDSWYKDNYIDGVILIAASGQRYRMKKYDTVSGTITGFPYKGHARVQLDDSDGGNVVIAKAKVVQHNLKELQRIELVLKRNTYVYVRKI
jgi:hypothetical protein